MDINLPEHRLAGVNEPVWCIRRHNRNRTGFHVARFIRNSHSRLALQHKNYLYVRMRVQRRALPGLGIDDVRRNRRTLIFADKFI